MKRVYLIPQSSVIRIQLATFICSTGGEHKPQDNPNLDGDGNAVAGRMLYV